MITINGLKFAPNSAELVNTLFQNGGTAYGTYKRRKNGTHLYRANGELFAYIVHNPKQGYFSVSACMRDGVPFYLYGMTDDDEKLLRLDSELIKRIFN